MLCPICNVSSEKFESFGLKPRLNAKCPNCGGLERHRFAWLFFKKHTDLFNSKPKNLLHVAPEFSLAKRLKEVPQLNYLSSDYIPGRAMIQMDLRQIKYPDDSFDIIYCSHVLEHIKEDKLALSELRRVLRPNGWAIFQVPILCEKTYEDDSIVEPKQREKAFGQFDHVRKYGMDFSDRLKSCGFYSKCFNITDVLNIEESELYGLKDNSSVKEYLFLCVK